jgi:hypothetical protein
MKLHEVLDTDRWDEEGPNAPYLKRKGPVSVKNAAEKLRASEPDHEYVGSGVAAYVGRQNNPHQMDRVTRLGPKKDGAGFYLKAVHQAGLHNNPYLPRLLARPKVSGNVQTAVIERLLPFNTPKIAGNRELMMSLWDNWFKYQPPGHLLNATDKVFAREIGDSVSMILNDAVSRGQYASIKDDDLIAALQFIQQLMEQHKLEEDIHSENIMWRMTGNMPQMVITDPLTGFLTDDQT